MDDFAYRDGRLECEDVAIESIAAQVGTPCFVYSLATLRKHFERFREAFSPLDPLICFSIKSCSNLSIVRALADMGAGMDVVSGGELHRALAAGVRPADCVYAGVGKSDEDIVMALKAGIGWFNIESDPEFENIARLAAEHRIRCRATLRINPDVDPKTHAYTSTGKKRTKFGVDIDRAAEFFRAHGRDSWCALEGLHLHIGSPVFTTQPYVEAVTKALALMDELARDPAGPFPIHMLDIGGGFAADYVSSQSPPAVEYAAQIVPLLRDRVHNGLKVVMEPGRSIAANAGILVVQVRYVKESGGKRFVIVDAGMNALLRPSHYQAFHFIWPVCVESQFVPGQRAENPDMPGLVTCDVVGPLCESGDFLALDRALPPVERGDLLAVYAAGAYGMSMASRYNSQPLPAEVLVDGSTAHLVRRRETLDDLIEHERTTAQIPLTTSLRTPVAAGR